MLYLVPAWYSQHYVVVVVVVLLGVYYSQSRKWVLISGRRSMKSNQIVEYSVSRITFYLRVYNYVLRLVLRISVVVWGPAVSWYRSGGSNLVGTGLEGLT